MLRILARGSLEGFCMYTHYGQFLWFPVVPRVPLVRCGSLSSLSSCSSLSSSGSLGSSGFLSSFISLRSPSSLWNLPSFPLAP